MKCLILTFDPPENVGGVEGRLGGYVRELTKMNRYVEVESFSPLYGFSAAKFQGVTLHKCPSGIGDLPIAYKFTAKRMKESKIDSVFLLSGGITVLGVLLLLNCRLAHRRTAVLLYGKDILKARRRVLDSLLLRLSIALANHVLTNSRFTASLVPFASPRKIRVLHPGVDPETAPSKLLSWNSSDHKILFVGRLIRRKGVKVLLDAFRTLSRDVPDAILEVVGDGPEREELERQAAGLGLGTRVRFLGTMRGEPLYMRYAGCRVLAMPSITLDEDVEGFGTVFLEAGLFGKPSVGTFSGGIPEAVEPNRTGLLVREGHPEELADALRRLLTDTELAQSLGQNARLRVLNRFTWAETTKQLVNVLLDG